MLFIPVKVSGLNKGDENMKKENEVKNLDKVKASIIAIFTAISSFFGVLAIPIYLLLGSNIIDYITGLMAAKYRGEEITSKRGYQGIAKKVSMWLLVIVGAFVDQLISYGTATAGIDIHFSFVIACLVAIWLVCNEIISILENISDMGVAMPSFLKQIVTKIKTEVETKADAEGNNDKENNPKQ